MRSEEEYKLIDRRRRVAAVIVTAICTGLWEVVGLAAGDLLGANIALAIAAAIVAVLFAVMFLAEAMSEMVVK